MKHFFFALALGVLCAHTANAQAPSADVRAERDAQMTRIVRYVAGAVMAESGGALTVEDEALVSQIARRVIMNDSLRAAEQLRREDEKLAKKAEREELITRIVLNVAKGIAITIALLVLRAIIGSIGKGVKAESVETQLGVLMPMRNEADAVSFGQDAVIREVASGGLIVPTVRSIYRRGESVHDTSEAFVILKTTNGQLADLVKQAETKTDGVPEIIALSRSMIL